MEAPNLTLLIDLLDDKLDDLEESLKSLLSMTLSETASKLPLLDKAQLYVLVTYAIESILFCTFNVLSEERRAYRLPAYLRLQGVNAKDHPVFVELTRVKQYFEKVQEVESSKMDIAPKNHLDKAAANRFIKHALVRFP